MKKIIIGILVVSCLAIVGYGTGHNFKSKRFTDLTSLKNSATNKDTEETIRTSIKTLLTKNKPVKCTMKADSNENGENHQWTSVTYVANNKMRCDVDIENEGVEGEKLKTHTISDGEWIYTWTSETKMPGMKMKISELEDASEHDLQQGMKELEEEHDYHCFTWFPVDKSKFIPPSDIEFKDMTEMMTGFQGAMQNIDIEQVEKDAEEARKTLCEMCEMAPDQETRNECRANAKCE